MAIALPSDYPLFLNDLKARIRHAQLKAVLAVNQELIALYWSIGRDILHRQTTERWGTKVIARLSLDLRNAFPDLKGFSRTNLLYMRAFAQAYPEPIVQQPVGQLPRPSSLNTQGR